MADNLPATAFPAAIVDLENQLVLLRQALDGRGAVRIVAMGSSSTAGRGDVVPYPYRLEMYLRHHFRDVVPRPGVRIDVLNRGRGGEEADDELARFPADIFDEAPALVIWQVGTNAVFHKDKYNVDVVAETIAKGLAQLRARGFEAIVMDPQYVPMMLSDDRAELADKMVRLIRQAAHEAGANLLQRWALMRHWHVQHDVPFEQLIDTTDEDRLHQSDWSTRQVSIALTNAILKAVGLTA